MPEGKSVVRNKEKDTRRENFVAKKNLAGPGSSEEKKKTKGGVRP